MQNCKTSDVRYSFTANEGSLVDSMFKIHEHYLLITLLDRLHNGQGRQLVHPMHAIKKFYQSNHHAGNEKCMYVICTLR